MEDAWHSIGSGFDDNRAILQSLYCAAGTEYMNGTRCTPLYVTVRNKHN